MIYPDTADAVRVMLSGITDLPEIACAVLLAPGIWRFYFGDASEATAYPLKGRFAVASFAILPP